MRIGMVISKKGLGLLTCLLIHCLLFGISTVDYLYAEKLEKMDEEITVISENMMFCHVKREIRPNSFISQSMLEITPRKAIYIHGSQINLDDNSVRIRNTPVISFLAQYDFNLSLKWNTTWELAPWGNSWDMKSDHERNIYTIDSSSPLKIGNGSFSHIQYYDGNQHTLLIRKWTTTGEKIFDFSWKIPNHPTYAGLGVDMMENIFATVSTDKGESFLIKFSNLGVYQWQKKLSPTIFWSPVFDQTDSIYLQSSNSLMKFSQNGTLLLNHTFNSRVMGVQAASQGELFVCTLNQSHNSPDLISIFKFDNQSALLFNHTIQFDCDEIWTLSNIWKTDSNTYNLQIYRANLTLVEEKGHILLSWNEQGDDFKNKTLPYEDYQSQVFPDSLGNIYKRSTSSKIHIFFSKWTSDYSLEWEQVLEISSEASVSFPLFTTVWFYISLVNFIVLILLMISNKKKTSLQTTWPKPTIEGISPGDKNSFPSPEHDAITPSNDSFETLFNPNHLKKSISIGLFLSIGLIIVALFKISEFSSYLAQIIRLSSVLLGFFLFWYLIQFYRNYHKKNLLHSRMGYEKSTQILLLGGLFYFAIILGCFLYLTPDFGFLNALRWTEWLGFIFICISAFSEELIFRKCFLASCLRETISGKMKVFLVFLQSFIWTGFHFQYWDNPLQLILTFLFGIYFGMVFIFSQDIRKPIVIHCLINLVGLLDIYSSIA